MCHEALWASLESILTGDGGFSLPPDRRTPIPLKQDRTNAAMVAAAPANSQSSRDRGVRPRRVETGRICIAISLPSRSAYVPRGPQNLPVKEDATSTPIWQAAVACVERKTQDSELSDFARRPHDISH
jgi:hypothetical protein